MQTSIREVAAKAGVALSTVSKAFDSNAKVSVRTRERVRRVAHELGYHPSAIARALSRRQINTIGVILPPNHVSPIQSGFYSTAFNALLAAAVRHGQDTTVCTGRKWVDEQTSLSQFCDGRCDGFIVFWQPPESDILPAFLDNEIPVVLVYDRADDPRLSFVDVDSVASAKAMTEHLLTLGHKRIALLCGDRPLSCVAPRIEGYCAALTEAGITPDPRLIPPGGFAPDSVRARTAALMALPESERPTAIFCAADHIALLVLRTLRQMGLRVPEDVSVAGHDDLPTAALEHPSLSTMRLPFDKIAEQAVDTLLAQGRDINTRGKRIQLPAELVVRGSVAPLPDKHHHSSQHPMEVKES